MRGSAVRWAAVVASAAMVGATAAGPAGAAAPANYAGGAAAVASVERESFETGMGGWEADTDGRARDWLIYRTGDQAVDGKYGLGLFLNGLNDEGIIWIERKFTAQPKTTVPVKVSFWMHSDSGGDINAWAVVGYAGDHDPETTADMRTVIGPLSKKGWSQFTFSGKVVADDTGSVWVAVGLWATFETIRTNHLDLVETSIG